MIADFIRRLFMAAFIVLTLLAIYSSVEESAAQSSFQSEKA